MKYWMRPGRWREENRAREPKVRTPEAFPHVRPQWEIRGSTLYQQEEEWGNGEAFLVWVRAFPAS